ncbi:Zinc finger, CCCH-type [Fagus crenata]
MVKTDRLVKGWLIATLSKEVFGIVVGLDTAIEVWNALVHAFARVSSYRSLALKQRLTSMNRGTDTLAEYLCDDLAALGMPVPDHKKSWWLLNGLGKGYEMFTTTMLRPPIPPYSEIVTLLESHSKRHQLDTQTQAAPQMAFYNQRSNKNKKHNGSSNSFNSRGCGFPKDIHLVQGNQINKMHDPKICNKRNHTALKCFNRFNHSFTPEIIPQALAAITIADNQDLEWFPDTRATDHITGNNLHSLTPYTGSGGVMVGNGDILQITHVGQANIESGNKSLQLNDVLLVPNIKKDLISVSKLTSDLPLKFEFDGDGFVIKDKSTNRVVARGTEKGGLYALVGESKDGSNAESFFSSRFRRVDNECWHQRLGHPHQWFNAKIHIFQSDEEGEFGSGEFTRKLANLGIHHQSACPKTPEQNGTAERKHRNITELGLTMMFHAHLQPRFWTECFSTTVHLINRLPSPTLDMESPFFRLYAQLYDTNPIEGELSTFSDWEESSLPKQMTNAFPISSFAPPTTNHMDCQQDSTALPTLTEPETSSLSTPAENSLLYFSL